MRSPIGRAYGYSRHKNRMPELYRDALKDVLPRSEALVNAMLRFGSRSVIKCLPENSNPGPREEVRTGIAYAAQERWLRT